MRIVNDKLLAEFRATAHCEACRDPTFYGCDPHHAFITRGKCRLDLRINLVPLCRDCHRRVQGFRWFRDHMLIHVAYRERCNPDDIMLVLHLFVRLPKDCTDAQFRAAVMELSPSARKLARREWRSKP